jgi:hypothetical protein
VENHKQRVLFSIAGQDIKNIFEYVSVGSVNNINKLSLVGMQLPEKYKENFDVSSEGPSTASIVVVFEAIQNTCKRVFYDFYHI